MPLGPVLKFIGMLGNDWGVSVLMLLPAAQASPQVSVNGKECEVQKLLELKASAHIAWRASFAITLNAQAQAVRYSVDDQEYSFTVPVIGAMPMMAYASCNGFSDPKLMNKVSDKNAMWSRLSKLHAKSELTRDQAHGPLHLLLMGGDQIYSDAMWSVCKRLAAWCDLSSQEQLAAAFTADMEAEVRQFFESTYIKQWSQTEVTKVMSSVPSIMMWDDHDIMDGWGSYPAELHHCEVYQGIFRVAREYFSLFQQHSAPGTVPPCTLAGQAAYTAAYHMGTMSLLALDMRSERQPEHRKKNQYWPEQVIDQASWDAIYAWLSDLQVAVPAPKHLLVMTSIPVVHPDFQTLESMLRLLPGQQELEDDLRDQWTSTAHAQERLRLVKRLLEFSAKAKCRVTLLSGDVHVGAVGVIKSDRNDVPPNARVINQLTSSGIVHPAPPGMVIYYLEHNSCDPVTLDRGITTQLYEFPATNFRIIGGRNMLTLEPDSVSRLWANWWVEGKANPYTKVIHPVQDTGQALTIEPSSIPQ